jgi:leucyl/phenylalanyl-tRNA---protein transferase
VLSTVCTVRATPTADELLAAYCAGWFPMDIDGQIGFYEFDPRAVLPLDAFRVPRSVRRALREDQFEIRRDTAFDVVVAGCGEPREGGEWLSPRLADAYRELHEAGFAHSVEAWFAGRLVGGLFGVALGGLFTSESMFHRVADAGNAALVATHAHLVKRGFTLWDIQMTSPHTERFGAIELGPAEYRRRLAVALERPVEF